MQREEKKKKSFFKIDMISSAGNSVPNWFVILAKNHFQVDLKYLPRAIAVTVISIFLYPFVLLEKIIYDRRIKKTKIKSPVFIIGHMRSGTTFMHYLLSKDDRFAYVTTSETIFPWVFLTLEKIIKPFVRWVMPNKRPMDNMKFNEEFPQEEELAIANLCPYSPNNGAYFPRNLEKFYRKYSLFEDVSEKVISKWKKTYKYFLQKTSYKCGGKRVLSKSLVNSSRVKQLIEMFPDAKFVFIYRNPYKLFYSTKKLYKKFIFKNMSFHDISDEELENVILKLAKIGYEKYISNKSLVKEGNLVEVKFEEFVKSPVEHLKKIYETLGIDGFEKVKPQFVELAKDYENYKADRYEISENLRERIYNDLNVIFTNYGYSKNDLG